MKKFIFFLYFIFCLPVIFWAQNYYIELPGSDASGFNTAPYQDSLEAHAHALNLALPDSFRSQFRVYDFGFYQHHEVTDGYPEAFEKKKAEVAASTPYYLLFGKQTDREGVYTKIWVDVKLPESGLFNCIDSISSEYREGIVVKINIIANDIYKKINKTAEKYSLAEIAAMDSLRTVVALLNACCISYSNCTNCPFNYSQFKTVVSNFNMLSFDVHEIIKETDTTEFQYSPYKARNTFNNLIDIDSFITYTLNQYLFNYPEKEFRVYHFSFPENCKNIFTIRDSFLNDDADVGLMIGIVPENGNIGSVFWQLIEKRSPLTEFYYAKMDTFNIKYEFNSFDLYTGLTVTLGLSEPIGQVARTCGENCNYYLEFKFADPITTPLTLTTDTTLVKDGDFIPYSTSTNEPLLTKIYIMKKDKIFSLLNQTNAFTVQFSDIWDLWKHSNGLSQGYDFSSKDFFLDRENFLFITDSGGDVYGHNFRNMGNFLFGSATYIMNVPEWLALLGAHVNNATTPGQYWTLDAPDDQLSIKLGRKYAELMKWQKITGGKANIFKD